MTAFPAYMLWFVGTGINGYRGLSVAALDVLRKCDIVYIERFTSAVSEVDLKGLNSLLEVNIQPVQRWFVEDGQGYHRISQDQKCSTCDIW